MASAMALNSHPRTRVSLRFETPRFRRSMCEYILFRPTGEIEPHPDRDKFETGFRQIHSSFSLQHLVESRLDLVKIYHVQRRILLLRIREDRCSPIRALLLLGEIDAQHFLDNVLEPMLVGISPRDLGSDLRAIERVHIGIQIVLQHGYVEAGIMEYL